MFRNRSRTDGNASHTGVNSVRWHVREKWDVIKKPAKQKNTSTRLCESKENEDVRIEGGKKKKNPQGQQTERVVC